MRRPPSTDAPAPVADVVPPSRLRALGTGVSRGLFGELLAEGLKSLVDQALAWLGSGL
jgi:hypothetical protein